ncbi:hypothetical protein [Streptomyces sp. NPDC005374]|uniref:hypothetical protein n=1 Tax=Streptomyces sp. NPDC005374 TaxID=3364713 RepID=UPI0036926217
MPSSTRTLSRARDSGSSRWMIPENGSPTTRAWPGAISRATDAPHLHLVSESASTAMRLGAMAQRPS